MEGFLAEVVEKFVVTLASTAALKGASQLVKNYKEAKKPIEEHMVRNLEAVLEKAKPATVAGLNDGLQMNSRVFIEIAERASRIEEEDLQSFWAGLIASSLSEDGNDDSNLIFTQLLTQLTGLQAAFLKVMCEKVGPKSAIPNLYKMPFSIPFDSLPPTIEHDHARISREISRLQTLGLLTVVGEPSETDVTVVPLRLACELYVRCQGSRKTPEEYFSESNEGSPSPGLASPPASP